MSTKSRKKLPVKHIVKDGIPVLSLSEIMLINDEVEQEKAVKVYLKTLSNQGKELFTEIHAFAVWSIDVAMKGNNNFSLMTALVHAVKAMGNGPRPNQLIQWFEQHTPASFDKEKKTFKQGKGKEGYELEHARENPYYTPADKPTVTLFSIENIQKACETLIKRALSEKTDPEDKQTLKALAKNLENGFLMEVKKAVKKKEELHEAQKENDKPSTEKATEKEAIAA
jgi:hypothetical protein